ncbi:MAG: preprotein translocase subunit SecE [Bacteroidia bacterium]
MDKLRALYQEYSDELLYKVQWPAWEELQSNTITVFVACIIIAILIALMDVVFKYLMGDLIYSFFN